MGDRPVSGPLRELALYFSAQEFLTRLPTPGWIGWEEDRLARAARYFPLVGAALGVLAGGVWLATGHVLPASIAAGAAIGALLILTGVLHEDGFADCCDGLWGARDRARALEIMRDSRIGTYGAAGLVISIGLRWTALASMPLWEGAAALFAALVGGRAAMTLMLARGTYAREDGAARGAGGVGAAELFIAVALAFALGGAAAGVAGLIAVFAALAIAMVWLRYVTHRIGGYTGDTLGAAEQLGQIVILVILAGAAT